MRRNGYEEKQMEETCQTDALFSACNAACAAGDRTHFCSGTGNDREPSERSGFYKTRALDRRGGRHC